MVHDFATAVLSGQNLLANGPGIYKKTSIKARFILGEKANSGAKLWHQINYSRCQFVKGKHISTQKKISMTWIRVTLAFAWSANRPLCRCHYVNECRWKTLSTCFIKWTSTLLRPHLCSLMLLSDYLSSPFEIFFVAFFDGATVRVLNICAINDQTVIIIAARLQMPPPVDCTRTGNGNITVA